MSTGWHLVYFASDWRVPHRPEGTRHWETWTRLRGTPVWIGPPMTREKFFEVNTIDVCMKLNIWCDCEMFFPVDDETVRLMAPDNQPIQRWVCRRMLAMD